VTIYKPTRTELATDSYLLLVRETIVFLPIVKTSSFTGPTQFLLTPFA